MRRSLSTPHKWLLPLLLFVTPATLGVTTGSVGERTAVGAMVLWAEPLLVGLGVWGALCLTIGRQYVRAAATLAGLMMFALAIRRPAAPIPVPASEQTQNEMLWDCAHLAGNYKRPIRLVSWTLQPDNPTPIDTRPLLSVGADIMVLHGLQDASVAEHLAEALGGVARLLRAPDSDDTVAIITRGEFQRCGGREDSWSVTLPGPTGHGARAVLTFPSLEGVGVVPILAVRLSDAGTPRDWRNWPDRLIEGTRRTAAIAAGLGPERMLVVGDFSAPRTFRRLSGHMSGAGLHEVLVPPTWPATGLGLELLPIHALDRVWAGAAWGATSARLLDASSQSRAPVLVQLTPL